MPVATMRAPNENWQAPISSRSLSALSPKAAGRKQSPMNIQSTPAAMIQLVVFEDMNSQSFRGTRKTAADDHR
jgi:hypothetical protein